MVVISVVTTTTYLWYIWIEGLGAEELREKRDVGSEVDAKLNPQLICIVFGPSC